MAQNSRLRPDLARQLIEREPLASQRIGEFNYIIAQFWLQPSFRSLLAYEQEPPGKAATAKIGRSRTELKTVAASR
jgi:hypothetical protein